MAEAKRVKVTIQTPEDLISCVPYLLGFHPQNSLILMVKKDRALLNMARVDLPGPGHDQGLAEQLAGVLRAQQADAVDILVVEDVAVDFDHPLRADFVDVLMEQLPVRVDLSVWAQSTRPDAWWGCYGTCRDIGLVPDSSGSPLAAVSGPVLDGRDAVADRVRTRIDPATVERRAALVRELRASAPLDTKARLGTVLAAIDDARAGTLPTSDAQIAGLVLALADVDVRDAALTFVGTPQAQAAEELWAVLTREAPPGWRAEPACLTAIFAQVRGEGVLANIAFDVALADQPGHRLASLFQRAVALGASPEMLTDMIRNALGPQGDSDD